MRPVTIGTPLTASVATILFGALGVWYAGRVVAGRDVPDRISNLLHLLMSGAMVAMPWPWAVPALPQVVVFSAGAFWYVGLALFRPAGGARTGLAHSRLPELWYHAGMMLAMVWMAVAMIPVAASPGMTGMVHAHAEGTAVMTGSATWALAISIALGAAFVGAALWLTTLLILEAAGAARGVEVADLTASAAMAAGMSYALLVLMT